jgi:hypothetical protein
MKARKFAYDESLKSEYPLTMGDAVRIIQLHERGRQAKLRVLYMKELKYNHLMFTVDARQSWNPKANETKRAS